MRGSDDLGSDELLGLIVGERWFASKGREPESAHVASTIPVEPGVELVLVEVRFREGTHELYQLALDLTGEHARDALVEARHAGSLARMCGLEAPAVTVRPIGVEQSNSSVVLDERFVLKLYRKLEPGTNPELELLRALAAAGFANAPPLRGALEHTGDPLEAALAVVTELVPAAGDGWTLALGGLTADDPGWLPARARRLGEVTGTMHAVLAASDDPALAAEEPSSEAIALLTARIDEDVARLFVEVPELADSPLARRVEAVRDLVNDLGHVGPPGLAIRVHGDYHLGQVLWSSAGDWVVIDFEGEPGRPLSERRRRTSVLRDVAGMLRSFAYVAEGAALLRGRSVPEGWEWSCRAAFLDGWRDTVDGRLLPASETGVERLLQLFEVQKLLYELRYELGNRPDWAVIPAQGLERLLEEREP